MSTTRQSRSAVIFVLALVLVVYVLVSAAIAMATAGACDGDLDGPKTWQPFPPHWECGLR
jgi:hypothetical protein